VKILDFGLAKLASTEEIDEIGSPEGADITSAGSKQPSSERHTETSRGVHTNLTRTGIAIGTTGYMSPEQVRKEKLDARTDLFSFGLVLYEMAAGRRAFTGETAAVVHNAILNQTPALARDLNSSVPRGLDTVITKALEKDRSRRYQSAAEMREDIERIQRETQPPRNTRRWLGAIALLVLLASGGWIYWRFRNRVLLSASDTIVLAVNNQTGDPVFDDALYTALRVALEQTPYLNTLIHNKVRTTLRTLNRSEDAKLTPEIAREVCLRTNSKMVVAGSIADAGNGLRIELKGIDCQSGVTVARVRQDAASRNQVVRVLGFAAAQLRGKLGEPSASVAEFNKPLEEATSPSLEALQLLTEGYRHHLAGDAQGALPYYQRAIQLDPDFALAHAAVGTAHQALNELALAAAAQKKTYELRNRMTEPGRFHAEDLYYSEVTGEEEKDYAVLLQWVQIFPQDYIAHNNLAWCLQLLGQPDKSLAEAREAARLLPSPWSYGALIERSIYADRLDEAKTTFDQAGARKFDAIGLRASRVHLAFLTKDEPAMQEQWNWAVGKPDAEPVLLYERASIEAYYGHFHHATALTNKAYALRPTSEYETLHALREAEVGNSARAQRAVAKALKEVKDRDKRLLLALVFARAGEIEQAQKLADALSQDFPLDTVVQNYCLPTIRAAMKVHENDPAGAVEVMRPTVKYDFAYPPDSFNSLYPAYIRGLAYLQMGEGRQAVVEFQKLLDHSGIVGTSVIGALSHLQLARAQKMMGDEGAARKSYEDFLTLWKDADSDIPIYQQAKAEYAKLRTGSNRAF
jgi:tetratricopeptide (TPR) repeat protein